MKEVIFLEPEFKSMLWGGTKLATEFGYTIPNYHTGECWAISAHENGDCKIRNGKYKGKTLSWLWQNHRELFGGISGSVYPLLIKIIDAKEDLSIQVHPEDAYAREHEQGALGKTECWYILDCEEDTNIVIGHNAKDKEELKQLIHERKWGELIRVIPVKKGDFFQIEPGTVHAIKKGTLLLETQQNSDITYRLYDYDRLDNGKPRKLHMEESIEVIRCPHSDAVSINNQKRGDSCDIQELVKCNYYSVTRIVIHGEQEFTQDEPFLNVSVIGGSGSMDDYPLKKGDHFILPFDYGTYLLKGNMELIVSHI